MFAHLKCCTSGYGINGKVFKEPALLRAAWISHHAVVVRRWGVSPKICCHIMHANGTSLGICAEELDETTIAEAAAVEAEDFERAANLSAKADSAKARLASLDQHLGATDAACSHAVLLLSFQPPKCPVLCYAMQI